MERRAHYNLLRMHFLEDPQVDVEPWMVQDYRRDSLNSLFEQLASFDIYLDKASFISFAEVCDSPEQLTEELLENTDIEEELEDYVYLLVFELWRRLAPEKQSLSIFCDELDYQIYLFEHFPERSTETLEDMLANLQYLLNDEVDEGAEPQELFETIKESLAHDLEDFLYHFISLQMDNNNYAYSSELLEGFNPFVSDPKWFVLLKIRLLIASDPEEASELIERLIELTRDDKDLEFHMEFLNLLVQEGNKSNFIKVLNTSLSLLETEEDFQDLLFLAEDYFRFFDAEDKEAKIHEIIESRSNRNLQDTVDPGDPQFGRLLQTFNQ